MLDKAAGIYKAGLTILGFQPRIALEDCFDRITCREHANHMLDRKSPTSNNRLPAKDSGINRNPFQEGVFVKSWLHGQNHRSSVLGLKQRRIFYS
jgi:hypothetical protein